MKNRKSKKWGGARKKAFSDAQVRKMRRQYDTDGLSVAEVARKIGAAYDVVSRVLLRKSYLDVVDDVGTSRKAKKKAKKTAGENIRELIDLGKKAKSRDVEMQFEETRKEFERQVAEEVKDLLPPPIGARGSSGYFFVGNTIEDCDPRRKRTGEIVQIDLDGARTLVKWSTGEQTAIASAKVHRKPTAKKGYRVVEALASTTIVPLAQATA